MIKPCLSDKINDRVRMMGDSHEKMIEDLGGYEYVPDFIEGGQRSAEVMPDVEKAVWHCQRGLPVYIYE